MGRARRTARDAVYALYTRRLQGRLDPTQMPRHVGVIVDGNRRWARTDAGGRPGEGTGYRAGYQAGADKIAEFLGWCEEADVEVVTLWLLSTDNLNRESSELAELLAVIEDLVRSLGRQRPLAAAAARCARPAAGARRPRRSRSARPRPRPSTA